MCRGPYGGSQSRRQPAIGISRVGRRLYSRPCEESDCRRPPPQGAASMSANQRDDAPGLRIMTIYGTRPEAIKVAPIIKAIERTDGRESIVVVTGQHREMLDQVNDMLGIVPDHDMNVMSTGQELNQIASRVIAGVDSILQIELPDAVIVQGDTTTVMGAAIAAFNRRIPVVHLEAGLRSGDITSPFPEEANRRLTGQIASLHLAP